MIDKGDIDENLVLKLKILEIINLKIGGKQ